MVHGLWFMVWGVGFKVRGRGFGACCKPEGLGAEYEHAGAIVPLLVACTLIRCSLILYRLIARTLILFSLILYLRLALCLLDQILDPPPLSRALTCALHPDSGPGPDPEP